MIELLKVLAHVLEDILNGYVDFLHNSFVNVSDYLLDHFELLEKFPSSLKNILGENVLFTVYPQVWESFLS